MGAVTALYYMYRNFDPGIFGLILDSPFSDLEKLTKHTCRQKTGLPDFLLSMGLKIVDMGVHSKIKIHLQDLKPIKFVSQIYTPAVFIGAAFDQIVPIGQIKNLYEAFGGQKTLKIIND